MKKRRKNIAIAAIPMGILKDHRIIIHIPSGKTRKSDSPLQKRFYLYERKI